MSRAPVRVAHVIHDLRPGGTERRLLHVLAALDRSRFEPLLVCIDGLGPLTEEARALGVEPVVLRRARRLDARGIGRLAGLLRAEQVAVVHGWLSLANVFARTAGTLARVPVRIAAEGGVVTTRDLRRVRRDLLVERAFAPLTDAYVANSDAVADSLRRKGLPGRKIEVIRNGVSLPEPPSSEVRLRLRAELGADDGDVLLATVARLDPDFKDHATFVDAVAELAAEGRPVRAAIIGDGPGRRELEEQVRVLQLHHRVAFTGYRRDAAQLVSVADVSVLLTSSEGFSNALLESMAAGVPVVTTDIAPNREAVADEAHALLVPVGNRPQVLDALRRLLDDPALAARLGAAARDRAAEQFSLRAQGERTMALYDRLLARKGATLNR